MKKLNLLIVLLCIAVVVRAQTATDSTSQKFYKLLDETGMTFNKPDSVEQTPIVKNMQMHYEYAVKFTNKPIEIRYAIAPLTNMVNEYNEWKKNPKPGETRIEPNKISQSLPLVVGTNVGGGVMDPNLGFHQFPPEAVKREFGADWGISSIIPIKNTSFGTSYKWCMMVMLHKNNVADAFYFYLTDAKENFMTLFRTNPTTTGGFYALKFKQ